MQKNLEDFAEKAVDYALTEGCQYCDARAEIISKKRIILENNEIENSTGINDQGLGIRVLNNGAWGFFSISNPLEFNEIKRGIQDAAKAALYYSSKKKQKVNLVNCSATVQKIDFPVKIVPTVDELIEIGNECSKIILQNKRIIKSQISLGFSIVSKFFINSDGSKINQNFTDVVAELSATAYDNGLTQSVNITEGGRGGIEKLSSERDIRDTSEFISEKALHLLDAMPFLK